jgi:YegS/Rv2252/BmrU family lipid kinase
VRRLAVIVNPSAASGRASRSLAAVRAALDAHRLEHRVDWTHGLEHARELALRAAAAGEVAVGFGGDGLVGAIAGALMHSDAVVGVLPGGRGNDFARMLGIPLEPVAACDVLATGAVRELDLGQVGLRTFIGIASCGFDSLANRIANETRVVRGNLVYVYGALRAMARWKPANFTVTLDGGERIKFTGYSVAAANSKAFGGGMLLAPEASLQDGLLDVVMISDIPRTRYLRLLPTVFSGSHVREPAVRIVRAREIEVEASRPFAMYADGDPIGQLPVSVRALPGAVRVLVPAHRQPATHSPAPRSAP